MTFKDKFFEYLMPQVRRAIEERLKLEGYLVRDDDGYKVYDLAKDFTQEMWEVFAHKMIVYQENWK